MDPDSGMSLHSNVEVVVLVVTAVVVAKIEN